MKKYIFTILTLCSALYLNASVVIPRLTPFSTNLAAEKISLEGIWKFNAKPSTEFWKTKANEQWASIAVPGEWVMQGFEVEKGKEAAYEKEVNIPQNWKNKRIKLRCNGVYSDSRIFVNGKFAGRHLGGFTAFELDITDLVTVGSGNRISIGVRSESLADSLASGSKYAVHALGGITRDLFLFPMEEVNVSSFHIQTRFDAQYKDAKLTAQVEVANDSKVFADGYKLVFVLKDPNGNTVELANATQTILGIKPGNTIQAEYTFDVKNPLKWDSEHPYLYKLTCSLINNKQKPLHETVRKVGFRQIEIRGNQVFVNNRPIKLRGVCRHEVMPLRGRSVSQGMWRKDIEIFKRGNVNYIRTSHYPPHEDLLDACDELGMFVEVEAPFCWADETSVSEKDFYPALVNQHIEMVNRDKSHPSIIHWSIANESRKFKEYFGQAAEVVKAMDPTRPRIFSQWSPDGDHDELEIGNHHYPGPSGPDTYRDAKRPIVFDEYCHLNAYNRLELSADPGLRSMWGEILDKMYTNMYHSQGVLGGAIWAGIDDTFFLSGDRTIGYGTWGPIDGWRREKPEFWGMLKAYSPVRLALKSNLNAAGQLTLAVENRFNFSNLSEVSIEWSTANAKGLVYADVAPRTDTTLVVTLPVEARKDEWINMTVKDQQKRLIDEYKFQILPKTLDIATTKAGKVSYKETESEYVISTPSGHYRVDKYNGMLDNNPTLMLLPLNSEGRGIQMLGGGQNFDPYNPTCTNWVATRLGIEKIDKEIKVTVHGTYKEADGYYVYHFANDGNVSISYEFILNDPVDPRQIGIVFTLDNTYDELSWTRKGYWSVYPTGHIAAIEGTAKAYDESLPISGLAGPSKQPTNIWSLDQTAAGSNVFRSTKENIYQASLIDVRTNKRWTVFSDGTQCVRAWRENNQIKMLVADYNNTGKEGFLVPFGKVYTYKNLKKGDHVSGTIIFTNK